MKPNNRYFGIQTLKLAIPLTPLSVMDHKSRVWVWFKHHLLTKAPNLGRCLEGAMASFINRPPVSSGTKWLKLKQINVFTMLLTQQHISQSWRVYLEHPEVSPKQDLLFWVQIRLQTTQVTLILNLHKYNFLMLKITWCTSAYINLCVT